MSFNTNDQRENQLNTASHVGCPVASVLHPLALIPFQPWTTSSLSGENILELRSKRPPSSSHQMATNEL
ncbi:unnamed protein product [Gadus morhua 'NCC']